MEWGCSKSCERLQSRLLLLKHRVPLNRVIQISIATNANHNDLLAKGNAAVLESAFDRHTVLPKTVVNNIDITAADTVLTCIRQRNISRYSEQTNHGLGVLDRTAAHVQHKRLELEQRQVEVPNAA